MQINGTYTMNAPRQQVFDTLMNTQAIQNCLPGCQKFESLGGGRYEAALRAGVAGVKGNFTGIITLQNPAPPESYTLLMEGNFSGGFVSGRSQITLEEDGAKTRVSYRGEAQVSGPLAAVGQRLIQPAAKMVVGQFFKCMEAQIKNQTARAAE